MTRTRDFSEDYYAVLDVERGASDDEIRRAARTKQRETHPDLGGESDDFVRVQVAIEVLSDPGMRAEHDAWLDGRGRRNIGKIRRQRRSTSASHAPQQPQPQPSGPTGATRPPGTFVPRTETPPPERIPTPDTDVRRMLWFRTAWPEQATQWPPERAALPPLRGGELFWCVVHGLVLVLGVLLLVWPGSIAELLLPSLVRGDGGVSMWPVVVLFALVGAGWLAARILVRVSVAALIAHIGTVVLATISTVLAASLALAGFLTSGDFFAASTFHRFGLQTVVFGLYALTGFIVWRVLANRTRVVLRYRLLVDLAAASAPRVDDPTRVWGKPGQTAMASDDLLAAVNPMRAMLAQRVVGQALEQLQRIPGVRIVHGLRVPGIGTIAHAIIAGRSIALIDAQLWAPGTYGVGANGMITRDGDDFFTAAVEFPHIVERYHRLFGETAAVRGWITVLADAEGPLEIDTSRTWQRVRLATVPDMLREVGDWLALEGERVDRLLLRDLLRHRL